MEKKNTSKKTTTSKQSTSKKKPSTSKSITSKATSKTKKVDTKKKETKKTANTKPEVKKVDNKVESKINEKVQKVESEKDIKNNYQDEMDFSGNEIRKLLIIIGAVCAIMLAFYFITQGVVKNKDKKDNNTEDDNNVVIEQDIDYSQILMGSLLSQKEDSYYVLAYMEDDDFYQIYKAYIDTYNKLDDHLKVYEVNLSDGFNKSYIAEESYLEGSNINDIKVKETTLIRVEEGEIYLTFEGVDNIIGRLKYITE